MAYCVLVEEVEAVEYSLDRRGVQSKYLEGEGNPDMNGEVFSGLAVVEVLCLVLVEMEADKVVALDQEVEGKEDHSENMEEVLRRSLRRRLDREGDSVETDGCPWCLGDLKKRHFSR